VLFIFPLLLGKSEFSVSRARVFVHDVCCNLIPNGIGVLLSIVFFNSFCQGDECAGLLSVLRPGSVIPFHEFLGPRVVFYLGCSLFSVWPCRSKFGFGSVLVSTRFIASVDFVCSVRICASLQQEAHPQPMLRISSLLRQSFGRRPSCSLLGLSFQHRC
jgi:hypothetical protein